MVWKLINIDNQGSDTVYGGDDIKKINKYLSGFNLQLENTSDEVNINTDTTFGSENFRLSSPTTGFKYIWRTQDISADRIVSLPLMLDDGEIALSAAGSSTDWGDFPQTFRHQNILFRNPANTFSYVWNTSAITATRNIYLPLLGGDDTVVFADATQILNNKTLVSPIISAQTINTDSNTIKHSTTNNAGDLLSSTGTKYDRKPRGTANQVLVMNATGTDLTWIDQANLQVTGGGGGGGSTAAYPVPTVNSIIYGAWYGTSAIAASGVWSDFLTNMSTVVPVNISDGTGRMGLNYTLASDNAAAGFRTNDEHFTRQNDPELFVRYRVLLNGQDAEYRIAMGFIDEVTHVLDTGTNNLANRSAFMWYRDDVLTEDSHVGRNDGDASQDNDSTQSVPATNESVHTVRVFADSLNSRFGVSLDGANATYYTTEIPASTTKLGCVVNFVNDDANTRNFELYGAYFKCKVI